MSRSCIFSPEVCLEGQGENTSPRKGAVKMNIISTILKLRATPRNCDSQWETWCDTISMHDLLVQNKHN